MVITPENFVMIRSWEHSQKGVTDRQTDGQTDRQTDRQTENTILRAAWSQLKRCDRQIDGRTDRQMENTICRAAWSQLKTIGHLFYITSSFVHHLIAISEFKLELQSENAQFGSKSMVICPV